MIGSSGRDRYGEPPTLLPMSVAVGRLLERERELDRIGGLLDAARAGTGAFVVVSGAAGIGKTRLARAAREEAEARGFRVLHARGAELEHEYAFGVVRQWFDSLLRTPRDELPLEGAAALAAPVLRGGAVEAGDASFAALHGLYWLTASVAERRPLMLILDDAQWSDDASLRFVGFLARRVDDLPVVLLVTARESASAALDELAADASAVVLALRPLGVDATAAFLRDHTDDVVDEAFAVACREATGGNPFLLGELTRALAAQEVAFTAANAGRVPEVGPRSVATAVLLRLAGLAGEAPGLAAAAAVAGDDAPLPLVAALAGLDESEASAAADALSSAGLLEDARPLRFVHPIVRAAIHDNLLAGERETLHERAAAFLAANGAPPEAVAVHLLALAPRGDVHVVATLAEAASSALSRGAPDAAATLLARALAEPPPATERPRLLLELGRAEHALERPAAVEHLREAHELSTDPRERARAALLLTWAVGPRPAAADLIQLLDASIDAVADDDRELALELEAARLTAAWQNPALIPDVLQRAERFVDLAGETPAECLVLANVAHVRMDAGRPATEVYPLAERVAARERVADLDPGLTWILHTGIVLRQAERIDAARALLDRAIAHAQAQGSLRGFVIASMFRAAVCHRAGDIPAAEADARAALAAAPADAPFRLPAVAGLVDALVEGARIDEAVEVLEQAGSTDSVPDIRPGTVLLFSRSWVRTERGDLEGAVADLAEARRRLDRARPLSIAGLDGRVRTALIHLARGDESHAREEASAAVEVARRWGTPGAIGMALRAEGLVRGDLDLLHEAATELSRSPLRLEHARALLDLGSALRRAGRRSESRAPLRAALSLADECGGIAVRERAREELTATGIRIRREPARGAAALTPSERRIVERAAAGASNPEIAQALFVTVKTVEMHLSNAYRKLDISSRHQLARALET